MRYSKWISWVASSWALLAVNLIVGLIATPVLLKTLGTKQFGWWMSLGAYAMLLSLLEGGMGGAATRFLAAESDPDLSSGIATTVLLWTRRYALVAIAIASGAALLGPSLFRRLQLPPEEIRVTLFVMGISIAVGILASGPTGALQAYERWIARNAIQIGRQLFWLAGVGIAFWKHWNLSQLVLFTLVLSCLHLGVTWGAAIRFWRPGRPAHLDHEIFRYAGIRAVTGILDQLAFSGPTLLAGGLLGSTAAAAVGVAERLGNLVRQGIFSVSQLYLPRASRLFAGRSIALKTNLTRGFLVLLLLTTPPMSVMLISQDRFLCLWIGPQLGPKVAALLPFILVPLWILLCQMTTIETFYGAGRPEYGLVLQVTAATIFLIAAPLLSIRIGTTGIVIGQAMGGLMTSLVLLPGFSRWRYAVPNMAWITGALPILAFAGIPATTVTMLACRPARSMAVYICGATVAILSGYLVGWFGYLRSAVRQWQAEGPSANQHRSETPSS